MTRPDDTGRLDCLACTHMDGGVYCEPGRLCMKAFLCTDCGHPRHMHEIPYGCQDCACTNGYWGGDDEASA